MAAELTLQQQGEMLFVMALLKDSYGGVPSIGVRGGDDYVVVNTCTCARCLTFNRIYPPMPAKSLITAAKIYGDAMICFNQTEEMMNSGSKTH